MEKSYCKKDATNEFAAQHEQPTERFNLNRISDGRPKCRITPGRQRIEETEPAVSVPLATRAFSKTV